MNQPDEISMSLQKLEALNDELQGSIKKLNSEYDKNHSTLNSKIKELKDITDDLEAMHKSTTMCSLVGSSVGKAGGVTALVGLALSPFTLGISLAVSGVVVGVAGGVAGATANITNMTQQKKLRATIEKIIKDFQNTIEPMTDHLNKISKTVEELQKAKQEFSVKNKAIMTSVRSVKTVSSVTKRLTVLPTAEIGKVTGVISALFLALDGYRIVCDSIEISEIYNERNLEFKSETLKFIYEMRETAAQFQETLEEIKSAKDEINRKLKIS